jgi:hypothetical protein
MLYYIFSNSESVHMMNDFSSLYFSRLYSQKSDKYHNKILHIDNSHENETLQIHLETKMGKNCRNL